MIICALRDALRSTGATASHNAATNLTNFYLSDSGYDLGGEEISPKLTPNQTNRAFYEEYILSGGDVEVIRDLARNRKIHKSNKLMAQAYLYFRDCISDMGLSSANLIEVANKVRNAIDNRLQIILITVADDYDAYLLFETLNDRGLALSVADLLKNYIFSKADNRLEDVQEYWQKMLDYLQSAETKRYLRHHWLSQVGVVREKDLYKEIKEKYKDKAAVVRFAKELRDGAQIYSALSDKDSELWSMFDPSQRRLITRDIEELSIFNVNQYNPLLLSTLARAPELFPDVIDLVVNVAFRYSIIGSGGTGNIEKAVSDAAVYVRSADDVELKRVFKILSPLYPLDGEFQQSFSEKKMSQAAIARYTLKKLNDHLYDNGSVVDDDAFEVNLEHILPQSFDEEKWADFAVSEDVDISDFVHRLGNMTLLKGSSNRRASNKSFAEKKAEYLTIEPLKISEFVVTQDHWTSLAVDRNQEIMAKLAIQIWRPRSDIFEGARAETSIAA